MNKISQLSTHLYARILKKITASPEQVMIDYCCDNIKNKSQYITIQYKMIQNDTKRYDTHQQQQNSKIENENTIDVVEKWKISKSYGEPPF